ncbi:ketoacid-CoA transferase [Paraburkholderia sp. BCC1886]|uniref:ketoacid-CoA transferase n=1 Tax=Paraburkholderia sp. BCC1886 TaxID=2562670 RepID=UPI00118411FC|nr:ketoacid-CoA transferase [Paraburkholderia sp. BCC1886]
MSATSLSDLQRRKADQIVVCMARRVEDGDFLAEGIGTFMSTSAYMLAKHMHAPSCTSLCPNGNTLMQGTRVLTLGHDEFDTVPRASLWLDYLQINLHYMPGIFLSGKRWTEFMRPAQIDARGATNNVTIGPHAAPRVRLPGSAGIPDASTAARYFNYYAPRHTRQVFVDTLDFISGAGNADTDGVPEMTITVVSDLGVLITGASGRFEVAQLHEGVTREDIEANTGFSLGWRDDVSTSAPPSDTELHLLDEVIDPQGLRYLEMLSGSARKERLRELANSTAAAAHASGRKTP